MIAISRNSHYTLTFKKIKGSSVQSLTAPRKALTFPRDSIIFNFLSYFSKNNILPKSDRLKKIRKLNPTLTQNISQLTIPEKHPLLIIQ